MEGFQASDDSAVSVPSLRQLSFARRSHSVVEPHSVAQPLLSGTYVPVSLLFYLQAPAIE